MFCTRMLWTTSPQMIEGEPSAVAAIGGAVVLSDAEPIAGPRPWRSQFVRSPWLDALGGWCALVGQTLFRTVTSPVGWGDSTGEMIPSEDQELWLRAGRDLQSSLGGSESESEIPRRAGKQG